VVALSQIVTLQKHSVLLLLKEKYEKTNQSFLVCEDQKQSILFTLKGQKI